MIGTVIDGTYRVERLLGTGSFGVVYACTEIPLDRLVAVKMLNTRDAGERELERFLGEARRMASLSHPNVVLIHRLGHHDATPYIVMEYLPGKPLRQILQGAHLPLVDGIGLMRQVAAGLGAIHQMSMVHRDLSTNNIFVTDAGTAKILDLGLAHGAGGISSLTREGYLVGTLNYVSPEQINGQPLTYASEIFSFGMILYEVVTGQHPFHAEHYMSVLYGIAQRKPVPPEEHLTHCPPALSELVMQCLEKQPEGRPQSIVEVERRLAELQGLPDLSSSKHRSPVAAPSGLHPTSRNPYLGRTMISRPEDFFGRKMELKRIYARLNAT
jgi:serine/threonine protein kinase